MNSDTLRQYVYNHSSRFFPVWNQSTGEQVTGIIELISYIHERIDDKIWLEIGSNIGESTLIISSFPHINKLYCIDPFYEEEQYIQFKQRIKHKLSKIEIIRKKSEEIYSSFTDKIDVIYIDGNHSYESVKNDLEFSYNIVRRNGFICGHDYSKAFDGVVHAVNEFIIKHNLKISHNFLDSSFAIEKTND